ncbi:MAG: GMC family oxidoreductase [Deltaproteobacteria bacterium]|nr:GMC family oxidoreductase [Deltaproteobacteria bacterium]
MTKLKDFDVIVIGSGAGGAPVAATLAQAGLRVLILEKGPYYSLADFTHDEITICRRDFFVPFPVDDPHTIRKNGAEQVFPTTEGWTSCCVGGATVHMTGFWYWPHAEDFKLATLIGGVAGANLADWPISYAEIEPYLYKAEVLIGVSGQAGINPFDTRKRPYPLPALRPHPSAALIDRAAKEIGMHAFPTARAVLSQAYGTRPACNQCGYCGDYGCENASKSSMLATLIPAAEATHNCEVRANSPVTRIIIGNDRRVSGVEYRDHKGNTHKVSAKIVVLAASAIESARLLLLSACKAFPQGVANTSGLVGKNLTFSTFGKGTAIFSRQDFIKTVGEHNYDLPFLQRSVQDDYWASDGRLGFIKGGTYNFILPHPNPINAALRLTMDRDFKLYGEAYKQQVLKYFKEQTWLEFEIFNEFLPTDQTYIDLDPNVKDRTGMPVARIQMTHHPLDLEVNRRMLKRGIDILAAVTPKAQEFNSPHIASTTYHLQHGTCRFGNDAKTSVLNADCRAHDIDNLYVTDGSFMPTSLGVPTTPTIIANSFRVGDKILARRNEVKY